MWQAHVNLFLRAVGHRVPVNPLLERLYMRLVPLVGLPGPTVVRSRTGPQFRVFDSPPRSLKNSPDFHIHYFGVWEARQTRAVRRLVRPGDVCVDVGANIGWYTLLLGRLAGRTGAVHAFEPDPRAFSLLEANLRLNPDLRRVYLNPIALGRTSGWGRLYYSPGSSLYSSIYPIHESTFEIAVESLDDYLMHRTIPSIDFLKCDVEGSELAVLEGAARTLGDAPTPPMIQIEVNPATARAAGHSSEAVLAWLHARRGYEFYRITIQGRLAPFPSIQAAAASLADIICLVPAAHGERMKRSL